MTAAQTAATTDKNNERFVVITGTVPSREIEVASRSEATELAHRTNGSWMRVPQITCAFCGRRGENPHNPACKRPTA